MDLLGCPMCAAPACRAVTRAGCAGIPQDRFQAMYRGHVVDGKYMLRDYSGQYLLFTAGLQHIRLQEIYYDVPADRASSPTGSDATPAL